MAGFSSQIPPSQFAALLLASGESLPRARARDQQSDLAGGLIKQQVLRRVIDRDPDAADFLATLDAIIVELGEPSGPTRAMAKLIAEEWEAFRQTPELVHWLLDEAVRHGKESGKDSGKDSSS